MATIKADVSRIISKYGTKFKQDGLADNAVTDSLQDLLNQYGNLIESQLKQNLVDKGKNATFDLYQSIAALPAKTEGSKVVMELEQAKHWKWVDEGRKKGKVPKNFKSIIDKWINFKPAAQSIVSKIMAEKNIKRKTAKNTLNYLIRRKIAKKGIKPSNYFTDVVNEDLQRQIEADIIALTKRSIEIRIIEK
jgi:hypothetical protein